VTIGSVVHRARRLLWVLALLVSTGAVAQGAVPALTGHVNDQTATLSASQVAALEQTLAAFEARKGSQVAVLLVASTAPEAIEAYALRVVEQWKLGRRKVDDGVLLVIARDDKAVRIEVGYGLEGVLTDLGSRRIIDETLLPRLRQQDYAGGITAAVGQILAVIDGEALPAAPVVPRNGDVGSLVPMLVVVALAVGGLLRALLGKLPGAVVTGGVVAGLAWWLAGALSIALAAGALAALFTLFGGGLVGRGIGGFYGGGRGGGGGGGGFGGGGGTFGGGGASGRW
jgi:uncharacterized protein